MKALNTQLNRLMALVREPGQENTESLVKAMVSLLVADGNKLVPHDQENLASIVRQALVGAPLSLRRHVASLLAECTRAPCELVLSLAQDQIEVAGLILTSNTKIKPEDLAMLALTLSNDHTWLMATRPDINARAASSLITRQHEATLINLVNNHQAEIDISDLARLVTLSECFVALQLPLLQRDDFPVPLAQRIYWNGSSTLKQFIREAFGEEATKPIKKLNTANLEIIDLRRHSNSAEEIEAQIDALGNRLRPALLLKALHKKDPALFKALLARLTGVKVEDIQDVLAEHGGPQLATACLAVGLSRATFETLYLVNRGLKNLPFIMPEDERRRVDEIFANLSQNQALSDLRLCA